MVLKGPIWKIRPQRDGGFGVPFISTCIKVSDLGTNTTILPFPVLWSSLRGFDPKNRH